VNKAKARPVVLLGHENKANCDFVILTEAQRSGRILNALSSGSIDLSIPLTLQSR